VNVLIFLWSKHVHSTYAFNHDFQCCVCVSAGPAALCFVSLAERNLSAMQIIATFAALALTSVSAYPIYAPNAGEKVETCDGITCKDLACEKPFIYKNAEDMGTCCPLCWSDQTKVPEDRSFANGLTGGVGMENNADPNTCKGVFCPVLHCPVTDQMPFDGRCCAKCNSAAAATPAPPPGCGCFHLGDRWATAAVACR